MKNNIVATRKSTN